MKLVSDSFQDNTPIPGTYAFAVKDERAHTRLSENRNPHFAWADLPAGAKSLALICHDPDVPSKPDDVNKEGVTIPADLPRVQFCHWVLVDLKPDAAAIKEGEFSNCVTAGGKKGPDGARGTRQGINDYTGWFASDPKMKGDYFGYDGPCPPWNDSLLHHYIFTLYALDCEKCPVQGKFTGLDALKAIKGHLVGSALLTGLYSLNPAVKVR
jgi:Raf kinase inhibitor-like YbhB/YbcL family protein